MGISLGCFENQAYRLSLRQGKIARELGAPWFYLMTQGGKNPEGIMRHLNKVADSKSSVGVVVVAVVYIIFIVI